MAPNGSLYLPDLPKLFAGEEHILSWHDVPVHAWDVSTVDAKDSARWRDIFSNERVRSQIHRPSPSFEPASPASQKQLEAATAAINVPPSSDQYYDISQIKCDASFLSTELKLDQVQALRVVLLEWQNRPLLHLQAGYSEAELASLRDVYASQVAFDADFESTTFVLRDEDEFKTDSARRRRQIFIHFQECIGLSRTWLVLQDAELANQLSLATTPESASPFPNIASCIDQCMDLLVKQLDEYGQGPQWDVIDQDSDYLWQTGHLFYAQSLMQIVIAQVRAMPTAPREPLRQWFQVMGDLVYLSTLEPSPLLTPDHLAQLHHLVALTTLTFVDPASTIHQLDNDPQHHWMQDTNLVSDVHQNLSNAVDAECMQATPAAYAWALLLSKVRNDVTEARDRRDSPVVQRAIDTYDTATGRRASIPASVQHSLFEDITDAVVSASPLTDPIGVVLKHTIEALHVADLLADMATFSGFDLLPVTRLERQKLLQEVIVTGTTYLPASETYGSAVLTPQFALLEPANPTPSARNEVLNTCTAFLNTDALLQDILDVAASRFPFEAIPFLRLCRELAQAEIFNNGTQYITYRLQTLRSFTHNATGAFESYHTIREDENLNLVALDQNIFAFPTETNRLLTQGQVNQTALVIPADTQGEVVSEQNPPIVRWQFDYSGLHLIGDWLERHRNGKLYEVTSPHESTSDVVTEIILLLANLMTTTMSSTNEADKRSSEVDAIIREVSASLISRTDVIGLVFDILEQELQSYRRRPANTFDTDVLCATIIFARAVLKAKPAQFWQLIAKTSMVDLHGGSGLLYTVISGVESLSGYAPLTEVLCQLYQEMPVSALRRLSSSNETQQWRSKYSTSLLNNTEKTYDGVLRGMTQNMLEIFESVGQWKTLPLGQEPRIIASLSASFAQILQYRHGIGSPLSKLTACFGPAANLIIERLRPASADDARSGPIATHLLDSVSLIPSFSSTTERDACRTSLLHLSNVIVDAANAAELPGSGLEPTLLDLSPVFVRNLYISHHADRNITYELLQSLLNVAVVQKPVSLLGHLGSTSSIDFLDVLGMAASSANTGTAVNAWNVLNLLISKDQQWLSIVILTGSIPDKQGNAPESHRGAYRGKLFADRAIDLLSKIDSARKSSELDVARSVLKFMVTAQQNWSWTLTMMRSRQEIFTSLIHYVTKSTDEQHNTSGAERRMICALITDLASVHLQYAKSVRDLKLMKVFIPLLNWLTTNAVDVAGYNTSLHANLAKNFASKFGLDLDNFKNNRLNRSEDSDYYDVETANVVLVGNSAWRVGRRRPQSTDQSYSSEVERANDNLRNVESEQVLLHSFQSLCIEHAAFFVQDHGIQVTMAHISQRCLQANTQKYPAEQLFDDLLQSRANIALALMQRLVEKKCHGSDYRQLLKPAWESALFRNGNYEQAIASGDITYWRTSLMVVLLALQFHLGSGWKPLASHTPKAADLLKHSNSIIPEVVEIATVVIAQGISTIVSTMQEQKQAEMQQQTQVDKVDIGTKDIGLVLSFLEVILRMARLPDFASQLSERLIGMDATGSAMKLYMWSHLLASEETENDPVHAIYAMRLLVALSTLPTVAEELAVEGLLNQILTARVTQVLQKVPDGVTNLDKRPHCQVLYTIWAEGILPLSLNLLNAVRAPVAAEISVFVNAFSSQLIRASTAFQPRDGQFITLTQAKEVATLSLLSYMLDDYQIAGASAAVDPSTIQSLLGFDEHKKALTADLKAHIELNKDAIRAKVVPTTERELVWHNETKEHATSALVLKVLEEMKMAVACLNADDEQGNSSGETRSSQ